MSAAYIQTAEDAQYLRRFMVECDHGENIRLIARIENEVGMRNVDDILGEADGIMLCRTSLALELGPDKLGLMHKLVAAKAQAAGLQCLPISPCLLCCCAFLLVCLRLVPRPAPLCFFLSIDPPSPPSTGTGTRRTDICCPAAIKVRHKAKRAWDVLTV